MRINDKKYTIKENITLEEITLLTAYYQLQAADSVLIANPLWQSMDEPYYMSMGIGRDVNALVVLLLKKGIVSQDEEKKT